jgi:glycosyltransferase involved in cell wall biosynthesis
MIKLLIISARFWPEGSGGALATYLITKLLALVPDLDITLITSIRPTEINKISNVKWFVDSELKQSKISAWMHMLHPQTQKWYRKLIRAADIVYIVYAYPLIPLAKELGKRVIVHLHDYQPVVYNSTILYGQKANFIQDVANASTYEVLEHGSLTRAIAGSMLALPLAHLARIWTSKADVVVTISHRMAETISHLAPELKSKLTVIYNPLPEAPEPEEKFDAPTFIYVGGDSYVKGFHILLEASYKLLSKDIDLRFIFAGEFRDVSRAIIEKLNKKFGRVYNLLGYLEHGEILKLCSKSHALLFPSICEEPLPYAVIEAMLSGTIPIASRVGGVPEIVGETLAKKFVFEPNNADELAEKIMSLMAMSKEEIKDIGLSLRDAILKKSNSEVIRKDLLKVLLP